VEISGLEPRIVESEGSVMRWLFRNFASLLLAAAVTAPVAMTGCRTQETVYYNQWEHDTHREHMDLERRSEAEKREYAEWRRTHH
jgi:hypothetical protein